MINYEQLLKIVNTEDDLEEFLTNEKEFDYLYNFSAIRQNLLEWFGFDKEAMLLEIGAECGALTGLFAEKVGKVVAYEENETACEIIRERNKEHWNVEATSKLPSQNNKFDYVTVIGNVTPDKLQLAKERIKENGTLIVAADNKLGVKYQAGTTAPFGYEVLSKDALIDRIEGAGYKITSTYYPVNDFLFPTEVYSSQNPPKKGAFKSVTPSFVKSDIKAFDEVQRVDELIEEGRFSEYANSYIFICKLNVAQAKVTGNIPNSTVNISGNKASENTAADDFVQYVKYNSHRRPEFQVATYIIKMNDTRMVVKKPHNKVATSHIQTIRDNYKKLNDMYEEIKVLPYEDYATEQSRATGSDAIGFPFVEGEDFLSDIDFAKFYDSIKDKVPEGFIKVDEASDNSGRSDNSEGSDNSEESVSKVPEELTKLRDALAKKMDILLNVRPEYRTTFRVTDMFRKVFFDCRPTEGTEALAVCNLDTIFDNFLKTADGITCIDYEWLLDFPVPIDFLKYRMLAYLYNEKAAYLQPVILLEDFVALFGIDKADIATYAEMEDYFQEYVHGEDRRFIYVGNYANQTRTIEELEQELRDKASHIVNLENQIEQYKVDILHKDQTINRLMNVELVRRDNDIIHRDKIIQKQGEQIHELHKGLINPVYGAQLIGKKAKQKLQSRNETEEQRRERLEIESVGIYKYKYKDIMKLGEESYEEWITRREAEEDNVRSEQKSAERTSAKGSEKTSEKSSKKASEKSAAILPKFSILVPVYNVLDRHLIPCIESVLNQTYTNFELCLADDCSTMESVRETLKKYETNPEYKDKIKVVYRKNNGHISRATNSALSIAEGDYVGLLDCDDVLSPNALEEMAKVIQENPDVDFIYSDEDKIDDDGENRHMPHFKPDYSPDTLMSHMYTCHFTVYRKSIVEEVGGLRTECNGSQDYDLALRFVEKTSADRIKHIPKVLYHWRERAESTSGNATVKPYVFEAAKKAKLDALERRGVKGRVEFVDTMYQFNVIYDVVGDPLVSIVIPSKDNYDTLKKCLYSINRKTTYKNYEIILVDNGSSDACRDRYQSLAERYGINYIYEKMDFNFSRMNNIGVEHAKGDYVVLLNDDIEIADGNWLEVMLGQAQQSHTGAVGCRLRYPQNDSIQHIGVINLENGPTHALVGREDDRVYYFGRNRLVYNVLAVTAACLMVKKSKYLEVGGLDEGFAVAYNDVDFCMKLTEKGYFNVVRNDVMNYHHESVSRGDDLIDITKMRRLMDEEERLYSMHPEYSHSDPFYSPNLTSLESDFSINRFDYKEKLSRIVEKKLAEGTDYQKTRTRYDGEGDVDETNQFEGILDALTVQRYIYIEGWAIRKDVPDNNRFKYRVVLENNEHTYIVEAFRVYRPDLELIYADKENIDFTGYRCRFHRNEIADGEYAVKVLAGDEVLDLGRTLLK